MSLIRCVVIDVSGPIALFCLLGLWVYLCWKMRMASSAQPMHGPGQWRAWLHLAFKNLLPNG